MSIDYGASIVVGYRFSLEDALKPFKVVVGKDEFKEEDRFDEKTGAKTGTKKVQTEFSYTKHVWKDLATTPEEEGPENGGPADGEEFEDVSDFDFLEKLAERNGFQFMYYGSSQGGEHVVVFFPKKHPKDMTEGYDWGRFTAEGNLSWHAVAAMGKSLEAVRQKLLKLGLKPKRPEVILAAYEG